MKLHKTCTEIGPLDKPQGRAWVRRGCEGKEGDGARRAVPGELASAFASWLCSPYGKGSFICLFPPFFFNFFPIIDCSLRIDLLVRGGG